MKNKVCDLELNISFLTVKLTPKMTKVCAIFIVGSLMKALQKRITPACERISLILAEKEFEKNAERGRIEHSTEKNPNNSNNKRPWRLCGRG